MVLAKIRKLDCNHINVVCQKIEKDWEAGSNLLIEKKDVMLYKLCGNLLDPLNSEECVMAKLANNKFELGDVAKICNCREKTNKQTKDFNLVIHFHVWHPNMMIN